MTTIGQVELYLPVVQAVLAQQRVRMLEANGEVVRGTLRGFVPCNGETVHASRSVDLTHLWVRITTSSGFDTWIEAPELAERHDVGDVQFS